MVLSRLKCLTFYQKEIIALISVCLFVFFVFIFRKDWARPQTVVSQPRQKQKETFRYPYSAESFDKDWNGNGQKQFFGNQYDHLCFNLLFNSY